MKAAETRRFEFGGFHIDGCKRLLTKENGEALQLTPKVFDLLYYLVLNNGKIIEKDELMSAVWADTIVEESNLSQNISILRRVLGEKRGEHQFIATIPGHGYKFVADVREVTDPEQVTALSDPSGNSHANTGFFRTPQRRRLYLAAAALVVLAGAFAGFYVWRARPNRAEGTAIRSLAVLPFKPLVAENRDAVLEMGMADTLISRLGGRPGVIVRPLSAVRKYDGLEQDAQNAGLELGVDSVLDGSIQRWGDKIRVNVRLLRVRDGSMLWTGTFDEKFADIFLVQDAISAKVANSLSFEIVDRGPRGGDTRNPDAYRLYLQGRYYALSRRIRPDLHKGIEFYQQAIDIDPLYALAYAGMAQAYGTLPITSDAEPKDALPKARVAAQKALEIDKDLAEAHMALGMVAFWHDWDWAAAETHLKKAIELRPDDPEAHRMLSVLLSTLERHDEAVREIRLARELDPLSLVINALEAQALFFAGRDAETLDRLNKTFETDANFWIARVIRSRLYLKEGKFESALAEAKRAEESSKGNSEATSLVIYSLAKAGRQEEASEILRQLLARRSRQYVPAHNIAFAYFGLGDTAKALEYLETAYQDRDVRMVLLKVDPRWESLRAELRFIELMKRLNFE